MTRFAAHRTMIAGMGFILCLTPAAYSQSMGESSTRITVAASPTPQPRSLLRAGMLDLRDFFHPSYRPQPPIEQPPLPAPAFNPDPGGGKSRMPPEPMSLFDDEPMYPPQYQPPPLPPGLSLPRLNVRETVPVPKQYGYRKYPPSPNLPPNTQSRPIAGISISGAGNGTRTLPPKLLTCTRRPRSYNPYQQSILKGDVPVIGQDIFADITLKNFTLAEFRKLPTGSGISAAQPSSSEFFGRDEQFFVSNDTSISLDVFKGETAFKPVDWDIKLMGVYNVNYISVEENNQVSPDPRGVNYRHQTPATDNAEIGAAGANCNSVNPVFSGNSYLNASTLLPGDAPVFESTEPTKGKVMTPVNYLQPHLTYSPGDLAGSRYTTRLKEFFALQEGFLEIHLADLSSNYDFLSMRVGIQPFVSDFRGFIFADSNLGLRFFGNADNNLYQYNLIAFDMLEKGYILGSQYLRPARPIRHHREPLPAGLSFPRIHFAMELPDESRQRPKSLR